MLMMISMMVMIGSVIVIVPYQRRRPLHAAVFLMHHAIGNKRDTDR